MTFFSLLMGYFVVISARALAHEVEFNRLKRTVKWVVNPVQRTA